MSGGEIHRGEIWWADLPEPRRSEPGYRRPVLVVQADAFNLSRIQTVIVAVVTSNLGLADAPGNVLLPEGSADLSRIEIAGLSIKDARVDFGPGAIGKRAFS